MPQIRTGCMGVVVGLLAGALLSAMPQAHAQGREAIRCGSEDGGFTRCQMPWRDAELIRQESNSPCEHGRSWGVDREGLWVDRGCRGLFVEAGHGGEWRDRDRRDDERRDDDRRDDDDRDQGEWRPGPDWDREIRFQCESNDKQQQFCQVDVGARGGVRLLQQLSGSPCEEGYSWGWNRAGVWVTRGCRGLFAVDRRW
ncbi:DUF3011 domain-containing protein [Dyella halodurans]|uniref:DUF3011 domain-containing protein n=1 Tax=Dyella halodurans TaxID=1920171 RepID=A0ABV9C727_9GAMM|nr:DUF3011 domain-containing protein [Dyella halodurans]